MNNHHKRNQTMDKKATTLLVLKRLFTSRSTYKLLGLLLATSGLLVGSDVWDAFTGTLCAIMGGCGE